MKNCPLRFALIPLLLCCLLGWTNLSRVDSNSLSSHGAAVDPLFVSQQSDSNSQSSDAELGRIPVRFTQNVGQLAPEVRFAARFKDYRALLMDSSILYLLPIQNSSDSEKVFETQAVEMRFVGPELTEVVEIQAGNKLAGVTNYFRGSLQQAVKGVLSFADVRYMQVYPGIDVLVYSGSESALQYDFIVSPGASAAAIRLEFKGVQSLSLSESGDLLLETEGKPLIHKKPYVYQEIDGSRREIEAAFSLDDSGLVGFTIGDYDSTYELIIDPLVLYSTFISGSNSDWPQRIFVLPDGSVLLAGYTSSPDILVQSRRGFSVKTVVMGTGSESFLLKLTPDGKEVVFETYLGGNGADQLSGLTVDRAGDIYVAGTTSSNNFPTTADAFQPTYPLVLYPGFTPLTCWGAAAGFITKFTSSGDSILYSTYLGGNCIDTIADLAVDGASNMYVTGQTISPNFPMVNPMLPPNTAGLTAYIAKLLASGDALEYSTPIFGQGLSGRVTARAIAVGSQSEIVFAGETFGLQYPAVDALQSTNAGDNDIVVSKIRSDGSGFVFSTYLGGSDYDYVRNLTLDRNGDIYIVGGTTSPDFLSSNGYNLALQGSSDGYLIKLTADGTSIEFIGLIGGSDVEQVWDVSVDENLRVYLAGETRSANFPLVTPVQMRLRGTGDAFVQVLDGASFTPIFSSYYGGSGLEVGLAIGHSAGHAVLAGRTYSDDFPLRNAYQKLRKSTFPGNPDGFIVRFGTGSVYIR